MAKESKAAETTTIQEESGDMLSQLVDATGSGNREEVLHWLDAIVQDADQETTGLRLDKKTAQAIDERVAEIDAFLSKEVNKVLHAEKFQNLEGSWRGLQQLVENSLLGSDLRIQILDISKDELKEDMKNDFQRTEMYKKIYTKNYNQLGGIPLGTIVGDYEFSHAATDVNTLKRMAQICAVSHCPFVTSPSPKLFGIPEDKGWEVLEDMSDKAIENRFLNTSVAEMIDWRAFREMEDSRYVAMCLPKAMARLPYGNGDSEEKVEYFDYQEFDLTDAGVAEQTEVKKYCWTNAAYSMGRCMADAFAFHGWAVNIRGLESGGKVDELPIHTFESEYSDVRAQCPTQVPLPMNKDAILGHVGFLPLLYELNSAHAVFIGGQTVHKAKKYDGSDAGQQATANENLAARLPYIMAVSRAAHALQPMLRAQLGQSKEASQIEEYIHGWFVRNYVTASNSNARAKAEKPFSHAEISVEEDPTNPGVYNVQCNLRPHFQVEEINMSMSLVASANE